MIFIYDPCQDQHYLIKESLEKKHCEPLEVPAFAITPEHPSNWEKLAANCIRITRELINLFLETNDEGGFLI